MLSVSIEPLGANLSRCLRGSGSLPDPHPPRPLTRLSLTIGSGVATVASTLHVSTRATPSCFWIALLGLNRWKDLQAGGNRQDDGMDQSTTACSLHGGLKTARVGAHQTGAPTACADSGTGKEDPGYDLTDPSAGCDALE